MTEYILCNVAVNGTIRGMTEAISSPLQIILKWIVHQVETDTSSSRSTTILEYVNMFSFTFTHYKSHCNVQSLG